MPQVQPREKNKEKEKNDKEEGDAEAQAGGLAVLTVDVEHDLRHSVWAPSQFCTAGNQATLIKLLNSSASESSFIR